MNSGLAKHASRFAALALLLLTIGIFYIAVAGPLIALYRSNEAEIAAERQRLARFLSVAGYENEIDSLIERASSGAPADQFISGEGEAIIAANLQTRLKAIARSRQVVLSSARTAKEQSIDGMTYYGVRLNLFGQPGNVNSFINSIETSLPFLFVQIAHFRANQRITDNAEQQIRLDAQLDIYGAIAPELKAAQQSANEARQ